MGWGWQLVEQFRAHVHAYVEILHLWQMRLEMLRVVGKNMSLKKEAKGHGASLGCIGTMVFSRYVERDSRQAQTSDMGETNWGVALFSAPVTCQRSFGRIVATGAANSDVILGRV
jgi:hypothetical protein